MPHRRRGMVTRPAAERDSYAGDLRRRRDTVLRAVELPRHDGVVFTVPRRGTYVAQALNIVDDAAMT